MKTWRKICITWALASIAVLGLLCVNPVQAHSGSPALTVWSSGQTLTSTALNNNFAHLHNTLTAGLTDANLSTTAAISHSKLATPLLVPKAVGFIAGSPGTTAAPGTVNGCGAGGAPLPCNMGIQSATGITSAQTIAGNINTITLSYTPADAAMVVQVTPVQDLVDTTVVMACKVTATGTAAPHIQICCHNVNAASGCTPNAAFMITVFDQ